MSMQNLHACFYTRSISTQSACIKGLPAVLCTADSLQDLCLATHPT